MRSLDPFDKMEKEINELSPMNAAENGNQNRAAAAQMIHSAPAKNEFNNANKRRSRVASGAMSLGTESDDDISRAV